MLTPEQLTAVNTIAKAALVCEAATKMPAAITAAQAIFESAYLTRYTGNWNALGIKQNGHGCGFKPVITHEFINGQKVEKVCNFESYASLADCFTDHARLLTSGRPYQDAWQDFSTSGDIDQFVRDIGPVYATAPGYAEMIIGEMHSQHVTEALAAARQTASV